MAACAPATAGLRGGAHRRVSVRAVLGWDPSAKVYVCVHGANANPNKGYVGMCRAAETPPWRSRGVRGGGAPAHVVLVARVAYGLGFLAQKIEKAGVVLTEGSWWPELLRRVDVGEVQEVGRGRAHGGGCCRASPGLPIRQGDAQPCCKQKPGVREAQNSAAV